ncbi:PEGA domain-containing protein [Archangium violaceum]|uniref:PEGA domain-containing protein n=1 Tax=Archangium violaceum TaxID=83451 RepID=UPI0037C0EBDD
MTVRDMMRKASFGLGLWVTLLSPWALPAAAQSPQPLVGGERPWVQNVSGKDQQAARELFNAANTSLTEGLFVEASEKYLQALRHWDHPAIHYNLALALMKLDRPLEVHEHLLSAMRYGPEPLGTDKFENATRYKELLDTQLVRLSISCDEPGATVTMDGQTLFVGPGRYQGLVRPGTHSIVAMKEGYVTADKSQPLLPGAQVNLDLRPYRLEYQRRWPVWMPWTVMGTGLAAAAGGGLLHLETSKNYRRYDDIVLEQCDSGCNPRVNGLSDIRSRGDNLQRAAYGAYALGGAAFVTGVVLAYLNQPQAVPVNPDPGKKTVSVTPLLGGTNGLLATFQF